MAKVRLSTEVEPELEQQVRIAAANSDKSVSEWIEKTLRHAVEATHDALDVGEELTVPPSSVMKSRGIDNPPKLRGGKTMAEIVQEDRAGFEEDDDLTIAPLGAKPTGSENPPSLRDGSFIADAVVEDRRRSEQKYPDMHLPPPGIKPTGYKNPAKLRPGSGTVADAVLEDRGER